jgi:hypothetical protein
MYKGASRNLQHSHRVNAPMPTGGLMGADSVIEQDFIPSAGNMGLEECRAEQRQLGIELVRAQNDLAVAKRRGTDGEVKHLGLRIQAIVQRLSIYKSRIRSIREQGDPSESLATAVRELAPDTLQRAIFKRAGAINKEKFG